MRSIRLKRAAAMFFSVTLLLSAVCGILPIRVRAAEQREEKLISHMINVVYDDSNSMLLNNRLWWCYAKYSLEVFSAMMQDKDSMSIYYMSDENSAPRIKGLSGDKSQQQKNIEKIHNTVTNTMGTPFKSIKRAYNDLEKAKGYDEKWLVVITDGTSFDEKETASDIDKQFADCDKNNIKIVYLAIGDALVPTANESKGIYVYKADGQVSSGEDGILAQVKSICQRIFSRTALTTATTSELTLEIPASEIIVFAQGSNVSIGNIPGMNRTLSNVTMSASDKDKATINPTRKNNINIVELNASIATFTPQNGSYIAEGTYELPISADEYVIYYKPRLDVILELFDSAGNIVTDDYIPIGSYSIKYWLTYPAGHPKHREKIPDQFNVKYTLTCDVDGAKRTLTSSNVDLKAGETTITVLAEYLNFSASDASLKYVVEDFTILNLDISVEYLQQDYQLSTLETDNKGILVRVSKDGKNIPADEWERFVLKCSIDNPDFKVVKNDDSTFMIYPQYKNGDRSLTATGEIPFDILVSAENDHRVTDAGKAAAKINIFDDITAVVLGVDIAKQSEECDNINFESQNTDRTVTISWDGRPLTRAQYDALKLSVEINDPDIAAQIQLDPYVEGKPTTATIKFTLVPDSEGNMPEPKELHGTKRFKVNAIIENEGQTSEGSATGTLYIKDTRPLPEVIKDWLPYIIGLAAALFLIIGYLPGVKKRLPLHSKYSYGMGGANFDEINWYNNPITIFLWLLPYVPVSSTATTSLSRPSVTLKVKSAGGSTAYLKNAAELSEKQNLLIDGSECDGATIVSLHDMSVTKRNGKNVTTLSD